MAKQDTKDAAHEIQSLFNPKGYEDVIQTMAQTTERGTAILVEAGTRTTDIASDSMKEAFENLREFTQVRDDPSDYGRAYTDFVQKQMDLMMRTVQAYTEVVQSTASETSDFAAERSKRMAEKASEKTQQVMDKAADKAQEATDKAASKTEEAADKAASNAKKTAA